MREQEDPVYGIDASDVGCIEKQTATLMEARGRNAASGLAELKDDPTARERGPPSQSRPDLPHGGRASCAVLRAQTDLELRRRARPGSPEGSLHSQDEGPALQFPVGSDVKGGGRRWCPMRA